MFLLFVFVLFFLLLCFTLFCDLAFAHIQKPKTLFEIQKDDRIIVLDLGIFMAMLLREVIQKWLYCPLNPPKIAKCGSCYKAITANFLYKASGLILSHYILFITYSLPCVYLHSNLYLGRKVFPFPPKAFNWSEGDQQVVCIKFH